MMNHICFQDLFSGKVFFVFRKPESRDKVLCFHKPRSVYLPYKYGCNKNYSRARGSVPPTPTPTPPPPPRPESTLFESAYSKFESASQFQHYTVINVFSCLPFVLFF